MTIAVAVRTGSAVVFAADSKITTMGVVGLQEDGNPSWVEQTYDNATKIAHDLNRRLMAMVAGEANFGQVLATDFISTKAFPDVETREDQDAEIEKLVSAMRDARRAFWEKMVSSDQWPMTTLLLAAPSPHGNDPLWRIDFRGDDATMEEILTQPGIRLEGSYAEVYGLLYGYEPRVFSSVIEGLGIEPERVQKALDNRKVLSPLHKMPLWSMPVQDAIDMAVFIAEVQVQMDRFLPGTPACGGPIDVLILQMAPQPGITALPGKSLHHPRRAG
jgi:hypothetical protein